MDMRQRQCRVWWPQHLSSCGLSNHILLFGWCIRSAFDSVDFVIAGGASEELLQQLDLEDVLDRVNKRMPESLKSRSTFCLLGHCRLGTWCDGNPNSADAESHGSVPVAMRSNLKHLGIEDAAPSGGPGCQKMDDDDDDDDGGSSDKKAASNCRTWKCGCYELNGSLEKNRQSSIRFSDWVQLDSREMGPTVKWVPKLHHFHSNGQLLPVSHVHLIIYELPSFGGHHFSSSDWSSMNPAVTPVKKPKWVADLGKRRSSFDLEAIVLALNCANAAKDSTEAQLGLSSSLRASSAPSLPAMAARHVLAVLLASLSALLHATLQLLRRSLGCASEPFFQMFLVKLFGQTSKNVQIRSSQLLYWSFFLHGAGPCSPPDVEYAHRAALRKHAVWSSIAVDLLLGNALGLLLLVHREDICLWAPRVSRSITDNLLRSGSVWLMGVPAGFKLNTELAELFGLVSLNAVQIWSTLWFYVGFLFRPSLVGLALSGMLLGATIPAALCIDLLKLATLHVTALHWLISFLYSRQIWTLTSLWRLFRGQKWNPLRLRLDSFDYSVEQHVVGSLLFTPILLLLPTTSVFYIFFTIASSSISLLCITLEVAIAVLHATPCAEVFLWTVSRRRFPSGLWLDHETLDHRREEEEEDDDSTEQQLVSSLRSNYAKIGQILGPRYRNIFSGASPSSGSSSIYGVLGGQRVPSTLGVGLPAAMPWTSVRSGEYWRLCRSAVLAGGPDRRREL